MKNWLVRKKKVAYTGRCPVCGEEFKVTATNLPVEGVEKVLEAIVGYVNSHCEEDK